MSGPMRGPMRGPLSQSVAIGLRAVWLATAALALGWAAGNCRRLPPDTQAVVQRLGRIVRTQPAGLLLALPRPFETVTLLPGPERLLSLRIDDQPGDPLLVGDGSVVGLAATLVWRVSDPAAYAVSAPHVPAALRRLYRASAVRLAAGRDLDQFLIARPERGGASAEAQARREGLRGALAAAINERMSALAADGAPLGVAVARVDAQALLPPAAKLAFDSVLDAGQMADQGLAAARTDAERTAQAAAREQDRIVTEAHAAATERVARARAATAGIAAVAATLTAETRPAVLQQLYRERLVAVLRAAGSVVALDGTAGRVVLPGPPP